LHRVVPHAELHEDVRRHVQRVLHVGRDLGVGAGRHETALRAVARKIHAKRQADPNATGIPIDPEAEEVQQLKSAAMPLLFQLREDQKSEVRSLARIIGLEKVAAMI